MIFFVKYKRNNTLKQKNKQLRHFKYLSIQLPKQEQKKRIH